MTVILAYLFQGIVHNVPSRRDLFLLSDSIYAVKCLILYHGIPLRLHEEDMICSGQVQPGGINNNVRGRLSNDQRLLTQSNHISETSKVLR